MKLKEINFGLWLGVSAALIGFIKEIPLFLTYPNSLSFFNAVSTSAQLGLLGLIIGIIINWLIRKYYSSSK